MPNFSEKLKFLMHEKHLSQSDISKIAGVSDAAITGWIKGATPRKKVLTRLAEHFKLSLTSLQDDKRELEFLEWPDFRLTSSYFRQEDAIEENDYIYEKIREPNLGGESPRLISGEITLAIYNCIFKINDQIKIVESATRERRVLTQEALFKIISKCNAASNEIIGLVNMLCACFENMDATAIQTAINDYDTQPEEIDSINNGD